MAGWLLPSEALMVVVGILLTRGRKEWAAKNGRSINPCNKYFIFKFIKFLSSKSITFKIMGFQIIKFGIDKHMDKVKTRDKLKLLLHHTHTLQVISRWYFFVDWVL